MKRLKKIIEWLVYVVVFFIPWQAVWIIQEKTIGRSGTDFEGVWQYGVVRVYATEVLIASIAGLVLIYGIILLRRKGRSTIATQFRMSPFFIFDTLGLLFLFLAGCSIAWSPDTTVALFAFMRLCEAAFLYIAFRVAAPRKEVLMWVWVVAGVIQGIFACVQFIMQDIPASTFFGISAHDPTVLGDSVIEATDRRLLRAYGAFSHPTILGAYLSIAFFWCCVLVRSMQKKWQWCLCIASACIISAGLFVSFARGAWLALVIGLIMGGVTLFLQRERSGALSENTEVTVPPIAVMLVCSLLVFGFLSSLFSDEMAVRFWFVHSRLETQSVHERVNGVVRAIPLVHEVWYRGTGIGSFTNSLFLFEKNRGSDQEWYTYQPIHTVPLMIFAELGIVGFLLAGAMVIFLLTRFFRSPLVLGIMAVTITIGLVDHFFWTLPGGVFVVALILGQITDQ